METVSASKQWDTVQEELTAAGLTDGLPVVPPTAERVARMLELNRCAPHELVTAEPLLFGEVRWQDAAINAVMAGCLPQYLPVVGAALQAMVASEFNLLGIGTTTGSAAPVFIVNGPIVAELGLNGAGNALGPGNRANATIGRAISLILRNVGGAMPGEGDMATLGQPAKYTCLFAENEAESPWSPLHVERGFAKTESVVTVFGAAGILEMVDSVNTSADALALTYAHSMLLAGSCGSSNFIGGGEPLILLPPEIAALFERDGHGKARVKAAIFDRASMSLDVLSPVMAERIRELRRREGYGDPDAPLRLAEKADDLIVAVVGGVGVKAAYLPAWSSTRAVSRAIHRH